MERCGGVRAGSPRAPEPRAREKTRGLKRKNRRCAKKTHVYSNISCSRVLEIGPSTPPDDTAVFVDTAARATFYHAMQIREKVTAKDDSAGLGENYAGSHKSALNEHSSTSTSTRA